MFRKSYSFQDIGLIPTELSTIGSRDDVDTSVGFLDCSVSLPIVVAPMNTVVGDKFIEAIDKLNGLAIPPRDHKPKNKIVTIPAISSKRNGHIEYGWSGNIYKDTEIVCIDVANSFNQAVVDSVLSLKQRAPNIKIITGNIASVEGYKHMHSIGIDAVRCGVGGGHVCATSVQTGVGFGQATLIRELADYRAENEYKFSSPMPLIIADGGIKTPGCLAKAIALGADVVMIGTMFGGAEESPGPVIKFNNRLYKQMAGQASHAIKKSDKYIEGDDTLVPYSGKLEKTWNKLEQGLRSAMSYMNCHTIDDFRYLPSYNFCLLSSGAKLERVVHANL